MRKIWEFIRLDAKHVFANVISLVVCVGMIVVPSFYAWFNIAGSWDPYGNTSNLKVAVANCDKGYTGELLPITLNMGERMESSLRESTSIGYTFVSEEEAVEGVRSGEYYAAIVFPEDFTTDMMSVLSSTAQKPQVLFYQNEKANAIASIVTNKASTAVQQDIDASFAESVTSVGAGVLQELTDYLDDDGLAKFASQLDQALADAADGLTDEGGDLDGFAATVGSAQSLIDGSATSGVSGLEATMDAGSGLRDAADGVRTVGDAVSGATDAVNSAIQTSASSLDGVSVSIDTAFDQAGAATDKLAAALDSVSGTVAADVRKLEALSSDLEASVSKQEALKSTVDSELDQIDSQLKAMTDAGTSTTDAKYLALTAKRNVYFKASNALQDSVATLKELDGRVQTHIADLNDLAGHLTSTAADLREGKATAESAKSELTGLVAQAKSGITQVQGQFEGDVKASLSNLASTIDGAADSADSISADVKSALDAVQGAAGDASNALGTAKGGLEDASGALSESAQKLTSLTSNLESALDSGDMDTVRSILSGGATNLADFISAPVEMDRTPVYELENNGSAMAPFYTTLAIWIGGVVLAALVKCNPSEKRIRETGCKPSQSYLGRIVFFVAIGFMQSLLILFGDLFFLGIQCEHPALFVLAGLVASLVFVNIIYALTASFGDVGKAIAVVLMVIQVAGSGGTFPVQMLPEGFQALYPFLPFVHSENAMRAAMFGIYNGDFWKELAMLAAYLVPALLLGLLLRKPVIKLNEWVEHKLESTKVM